MNIWSHIVNSLASIAIGALVTHCTMEDARAQSVPFNAYSVSTLGGNCTAQGSVLVQSAGGRSVCLGAGGNGQALESAGAGADPVWGTVAGTGTVIGPATSAVGNIAIWNSTTGTAISDSGVPIPTFPTGDIVGTTDTQTLTNKSIDASEVNSGTLSSSVLPTIPASKLPTPTASTLGGVKSATASANEFQTGIDTSGNPTFAAIPVNGANPSANVGLTAINGSASTYMRSDAAPALSQAIAPTWTGKHDFTASPPIQFSNFGAGSLVTDGSGNVAASAGCYSMEGFGAKKDATTDAAAWNSIVTAIGTNSGCISFGSGIFNFSAGITMTLSTVGQHVEIIGAGKMATQLVFGSVPVAMLLNEHDPFESFAVRNLAVLTSAAGAGNGIEVHMQATTSFGGPPPGSNEFTDLVLAGSDDFGGAGNDYFINALILHDVSYNNIARVDIIGARAADCGSCVGVEILGDAGTSPNPDIYSIVTNINQMIFDHLHYGFYYGPYVQGVTITASNFENIYGEGITSNTGQLGDDQLTVMSSQFGPMLGTAPGADLQADMGALQFIGNLFIIPDNAQGVIIGRLSQLTFTSNVLVGETSNTGNAGLNIQNIGLVPSNDAGVVTGNTFIDLAIGTVYASTTSHIVQATNAYNLVTTQYQNNAGSANSIGAAVP